MATDASGFLFSQLWAPPLRRESRGAFHAPGGFLRQVPRPPPSPWDFVRSEGTVLTLHILRGSGTLSSRLHGFTLGTLGSSHVPKMGS